MLSKNIALLGIFFSFTLIFISEIMQFNINFSGTTPPHKVRRRRGLRPGGGRGRGRRGDLCGGRRGRERIGGDGFGG